MSFKRDGDDAGQLAVLQRRRVAELLANYIPEDEALLLRSGRYACTVCPHRPVFDTLEVLAVHRAGRKHVGSLRRCYGGSQGGSELCLLPPPPQGSPAPLLLRTRRIAQSALLKAAPYSSCCRRMGGAQPSPPPSQPTAVSPTRRQALQRYLQLRSAGWIQDPSGKWVKDENAEFDSDEDEPPALLPT
uniref:Sodium channel modifier 1 n=1 Tax=Pavo cristatus TaxID=9049 RepID=A0A8C9G6Q2_PAVCR